MSDMTTDQPVSRLPKFIRRADPAVVTAFACIVLLLVVGSLYSPSFLSPEYLLQQLKVASFLGVIATGMMLVILLGQIDLSVPWAVAAGAMMASAAAAYGPIGSFLAVPFGVLCGMTIGFVNGVGVAYLRIPSMIITLATNAVAQGLMVVYTGGFSPQDSASPAMRYLATGFLLPGLPNAVIAWAIDRLGHGLRSLRGRHSGAPYTQSATRSGLPTSRARTRGASSWPHLQSQAVSAPSEAFCLRAMPPRQPSPWAMPICCRPSLRSCLAEHPSWAAAGPISAPWRA